MLEQHALEQYFWDEATIRALSDVAAGFKNPCCLCAPLLGRELTRRGQKTRILDVDERFAELPGFKRFDIYRPEWLGEEFGAVFCDPPFWKISLSQLFSAIRLLAGHNYEQKLAICYPTRRSANLLGTFANFNLRNL